MKSNSRIFLVSSVLASLAALAGCKSNPLPEGDKYTTEQPQEQRQVAPPFSMIVPSVMEFEEGKQTEYSIQTWVPSPGTPLLSLSGFPEGVKVGADGKSITWTPD